ncbi:hypothetical protein N657DRAFT_565261 [Parathielavia appendiculata]|uniref:IEC3 subunit of the Ino80 complex, chromatin re-modelling-domain-containing protein n=1 Tax=Parathielavia appendiculata TaxID=2587402 RepID=A0AAN6U5C4_9PEZI|nr:hypothetical protein N657DRAFT_565261 [Parathielavia appendiculata]
MKVKAEDDSADVRMADDRPTYRSWKKKYRKMRINFDQKMHEGEELYKLEQKALATARRLAVQNDRLLDLLLDVNNSAQIPPEKRIDLSLDLPSDDDSLLLDIDRPSTPPPGPAPAKAYKDLLREVPHFRFSSAPERFPKLVADLEAGRDSPADPAQGQLHPPTFLAADDIDNYIWELDTHLAIEEAATGGTRKTTTDPIPPLPTLAPLAHTDRPNPKDAQRDFAVRNPISVYNWLRKYAPKTFLQDAEQHHDSKENGSGGDHHDGHHGSARSRGGAKGERTPRGTAGTGSTRGKRASTAHSRVTAAAVAESFGEGPDDEFGYGGDGGSAMTTPAGGAMGGGKGKRKRVVDDDPGYRPKGGSSRPAKKKRKSEGGAGAERTPAAPKGIPRKSIL